VLKLASVLNKDADQPNAEFALPEAFTRALVPSAVQSAHVLPGSGVSGAGAACVIGKSVKQASAEKTAMIFRFFIIYFFLSLFVWPSVSSPARAPARK
jgi:hypothetical protein